MVIRVKEKPKHDEGSKLEDEMRSNWGCRGDHVPRCLCSEWLQLNHTFNHELNSLFCLCIYIAQLLHKYKSGWLSDFLQVLQNWLQSVTVAFLPLLLGSFF